MAIADKIEGQAGQELIGSCAKYLETLGKTLGEPENIRQISRVLGWGLRELDVLWKVFDGHFQKMMEDIEETAKKALSRFPKSDGKLVGLDALNKASWELNEALKRLMEE